MRLLRLSFSNLCSLRGEWEIDFSDESFASSPIFSIVGPTGAGKSTILDAMLLALYGKAPRISGTKRAAETQMVSRGEREARAQVVFLGADGQRYRAGWRQKISKKGEPQSPERFFARERDDGLEELPRQIAVEVDKGVQSALGMDYERFTRCVVLPQGAFDAFLSAPRNEKAKMLELITGTQIYAKISIAIFEKWKAADDKANLAQQLLNQMQPSYDEKQKAEAQQQITGLMQSAKKAEEEQLLRKKAHEVALRLFETEQDHERALERAAEAEKALADFSRDQIRLSQAKKAALIAPLLQAASLCKAQQKQISFDLADAKRKHEAAEEAIIELQKTLKQAQWRKERWDSGQKEREERLSKAILLDQDLTAKKADITAAGKQLSALTEKIADDKNALESSEREKARLESELARSVGALSSLSQSMAALPLSELSLSRWEEADKEQQKALIELGKKNRLFRVKRKMVSRAEQLYGERESLLQEVSQVLAGSRAEDLIALRASLERERDLWKEKESYKTALEKLDPGMPCPLCGALEHPYKEKESSQKGFEELSALEKRLSALSALEKQLERNKAAQNSFEGYSPDFEQALRGEQNALEGLQGQRSQAAQELLQRAQRAREQQLALSSSLKRSPQEALPSLSAARSALWELESYKTREQETAQQVQGLRAAVERQSEALLADEQSVSNLQVQIRDWQSEKAQLEKELARQLGSASSPSDLQKHFSDEEAEAARGLEKSDLTMKSEQKEAQRLKAECEDLAARGEEADGKLKESLEELEKGLLSSAFKSIEDAEAALLLAEQIEELETRQSALSSALTAAQALEKDSLQKLELARRGAHKAGLLEDESLSFQELEGLAGQKLTSANTALEHARLDLSRAQDEVARQADQEQKRASQQSTAEELCRAALKWERLRSLLGAADGAKYRNIVQQMTFDQLLEEASAELAVFSERYSLERGPELSLYVKDGFAKGALRASSSLSGGERFLVSLALALALSRLSGGGQGSMFLDEGISTLDEESLGKALRALYIVGRQGQMIGLISHLATLQESVPVTIEVLPGAGGRSTLRGPGVTKK